MDEEIKKRLNNFFIRPFKMYPYRTLLLILSFIIPKLFNYSIDLSNINEILYIFIIYIFIFFIILPIIIEMGFYSLYLTTKLSSKFLKQSLEYDDEKKINSYHKKFLVNYNDLRNQLKRVVRKTNTYLLTNNQNSIHILKNIDVFFDTTIKLIEKKEYDLNYKDFDIIDNFLTLFEDYVFKNSKPINLLRLQVFFEEKNSQIMYINNKLFEETKRDVGCFYEHKRMKSFIPEIKSILTDKFLNLIIFLISAILIDNYTDIFSTLIKMIH